MYEKNRADDINKPKRQSKVFKLFCSSMGATQSAEIRDASDDELEYVDAYMNIE